MMRARAAALAVAALAALQLAPIVVPSAPSIPALVKADLPYESAAAHGRLADDVVASNAAGCWVAAYADVNTETVAEDGSSLWADAVALHAAVEALDPATCSAIRYRVDKLSAAARDPSLYSCVIRVDSTRLSDALAAAPDRKPGGGGQDFGENAGYTAVLADMVAEGFSTANILPLTFGSASGWIRDSVLLDPACIHAEAVARLNALMAEVPGLSHVYLAQKGEQQRNDCYAPGQGVCLFGDDYGTVGEQGLEWKVSSGSYVDGQAMPSELPPGDWYGLQVALAQAVIDAGKIPILDECCGYRGSGGAPQVGRDMPPAIREVALEVNGMDPATVYVPMAAAGADVSDATTGVAAALAAACHNATAHTLSCLSGPDCPGSTISTGPSGRPQDGPAMFTAAADGTYTLELVCEPGASQATDLVDVIASGAPDAPPQVNAGPDFGDVGGGTIAVLGATVTDDGSHSLAWSVASGCAGASFVDPGILEPTLQGVADADDACDLELCADDGVNPEVCDSRTLSVTASGGTAGVQCESPPAGVECIGQETFEAVFAQRALVPGENPTPDVAPDLGLVAGGVADGIHQVAGIAGSVAGAPSQAGVRRVFYDTGGLEGALDISSVDYTGRTFCVRRYIRYVENGGDLSPGIPDCNIKGDRGTKPSPQCDPGDPSHAPSVEFGWSNDLATEASGRKWQMAIQCNNNGPQDCGPTDGGNPSADDNPEDDSHCSAATRGSGGGGNLAGFSLADAIGSWTRVEWCMDHWTAGPDHAWRTRMTRVDTCAADEMSEATEPAATGADVTTRDGTGITFPQAECGANCYVLEWDTPDWNAAPAFSDHSQLNVFRTTTTDPTFWPGADPDFPEDGCS